MARSLSQLFYALGGSVSPGKTNDELIDHLIDAEFIRTPAIQRVFRSVDRGNYYHPNHRQNAYKDIAWKMGNLHLSAPCVYSVVMETLKLKPGLSFLNLGSGSGYLSTMAGLLLGQYGVNHGIELHKDIVDFAYERLDEFLKSSKVVDENDFCEPVFTCGNCLTFDSNVQQYDRVYCGAACPEEFEGYIKNLVKINGILIMPLNDKLLKITRVNETVWSTVKVLSVSFAPLIAPPALKKGEVMEHPLLGDLKPPTLLQLCRFKIRAYLRGNIEDEHPKLIDNLRKLPSRRSGLKLFIVNCGEESDGEESESDGEDLDSFSLLMRSLHRTSFLLRNFSQPDNLSSSDHNEESEEDDNEMEQVLKFTRLQTHHYDDLEEDLGKNVEGAMQEFRAEISTCFDDSDDSHQDGGAARASNQSDSKEKAKSGAKTIATSSNVNSLQNLRADLGKIMEAFDRSDSKKQTKSVATTTATLSKVEDNNTENVAGTSKITSGRKSKRMPKGNTETISKTGSSSKAKSQLDATEMQCFSSGSSSEFSLPPSQSTRSRTNTLKRKHSSLEDGPGTSAECSSPMLKKITSNSARKKQKAGTPGAKRQPPKETFTRAVKVDSNNKVAEDFSHTYFLTQKIAALPLPTYLKKYMNYKRENF